MDNVDKLIEHPDVFFMKCSVRRLGLSVMKFKVIPTGVGSVAVKFWACRRDALGRPVDIHDMFISGINSFCEMEESLKIPRVMRNNDKVVVGYYSSSPVPEFPPDAEDNWNNLINRYNELKRG